MNTARTVPLLIVAFLCSLSGCGSVANDRPDNSLRFVTIVCEAQGMSTTDVEAQVTNPLEVALMEIPDVQRIDSIAQMGESVISVVFDDKTPSMRARQLVAEKIADVSQSGLLPVDVETKLSPMVSGQFLLVALNAGKLPDDVAESNELAIQLREVAEDSLRPRLLTIPGVAEVTVVGGLRQQCEVVLDHSRVTAFGLTAIDIVRAIRKADADANTAEHPSGAERITRGLGQLQSVEDIENIVLAVRDETSVTVKDVADVRVSAVNPFDEFGDETQVSKEANFSAASKGVVLAIALEPDIDIAKLAKSVEGTLQTTKAALPAGVQIGTTLDASLEPLVDQALRVLGRELPFEVELKREKSDVLGDMLVATSSKRSVLKLFGPELAVLQREAAKCRERIGKIPEVVDARVESRPVDSQLDVELNRKAIAQLGISVHDVVNEFRLASDGQKVSTVDLHERPCDLVVKYQTSPDTSKFADRIYVRAEGGELVPLIQLCEIQATEVPRSVHSQDTFQLLRVSFNTKDRNLADQRADIHAEVEKAIVPVQDSLEEGYRIQFGWK